MPLTGSMTSIQESGKISCENCAFYRPFFDELNYHQNCAHPSNLNKRGKYIISAREKNKGDCGDFKKAGLVRKIITALDARVVDLRNKP